MKILVTGGVGSIGSKVVERLFNDKHDITVSDIDETKLYWMRDDYKYKVKTFTCDIKDKDCVDECMAKGFDIVIHTAALKHVPTGEYHPDQMVNTNIIGALNVFRSAIKHKIPKVVVISTDKAAYPTGVMGASKLIQERIALKMDSKKTRFTIIRFGNVVMSRGGVIERFSNFTKAGKKLEVMDEKMTRFWMDYDDAVNLITRGFNKRYNGKILTRITRSFNIADLAKAFCCHDYKILGRRKGEKIHEVLVTEEEYDRTILEDSGYISIAKEGPKFSSKNKPDISNVKSGSDLMTIQEIRKKLRKAKMI